MSIFKWAGSKQLMAGTIKEILTRYPNEQFVEPFVGAFNVAPLVPNFQNYLFADSNAFLIETYNQIETSATDYIDACRLLFDKGHAAYYEIRDTFNSSSVLDLERVAMFQYLNKHCFNGLCRFNKTGKFNVPIGTISKKSVCVDEILKLREFITDNNCKFYTQSFVETFHQVELSGKISTIYCDPPYLPLNSNFSYTADKFGLPEQQQLVDMAERLSRLGHTVIISNHSTDIAKSLYHHATEYLEFEVRRSISCKDRKHVLECIAIYR